MINSTTLDNESIAASILSAYRNLNKRLDTIEEALFDFNSDLNNINDAAIKFATEISNIIKAVEDIIDGTIDVVECNQSYDSRWVLSLPKDMVDQIVDTLVDIKEGLADNPITGIDLACRHIYGACTQGHNACDGNFGADTTFKPVFCPTAYCPSGYIGGDGKHCISDYCASSYIPGTSCKVDVGREPECPSEHGDIGHTDPGDPQVRCENNFSGGNVACMKDYGVFEDGKNTLCKGQYLDVDTLKTCNTDFMTGVIGDTTIVECPGGYQDPEGGESCATGYRDRGDGRVMCTDYKDDSGESCGSFKTTTDGNATCVSDYKKDDASCAGLYEATGGAESCLGTFSDNLGTCTGYKTDEGSNDRTCVSNYDVGGGTTCPSGYGVEGNNVICASNVESGSCTSNVGQESCTFNAGCTQCYGSNHHQDCPQMGCWDVTIPE